MKKLFVTLILLSVSVLAQTSLAPVTEIDYNNATRYCGARNIARTNDGSVVVVYEPGSAYTNADIWYAMYNAAFQTWDVAQLSQSETGSTGVPAIIAGEGNNMFAAWKEKATDGKRNAMFSKLTIIDEFTHEWSTPVVADNIDNNTGVLTIDLDSDENPFILFSIWNDPPVFDANIYCSHSYDDGQTWPTDNLTSEFPTPNVLPFNYMDVNLAHGQNGTMYAAWEDKPQPVTNQYEVLFSKYTPDNGWTTPEIVTPVNDGDAFLQHYVDGYTPRNEAQALYEMGPADYMFAGEKTVIYYDNGNSKVVTASFNPYYQMPVEDKNTFILDVVNYLGATASDSILVVDDDNRWDNEWVVTDALDQTNLNYRVFDCGNNSGMATQIPTFANDMSNKKLVIWFTGDDYKDLAFWNIADEDNTELMQYLQTNGKSLFIIGRSWMYDRYGSAPDTFSTGDFVYDYLGIKQYDMQSWADDNQTGVAELNKVEGSPDVSSLDVIGWGNAGTRQGEPTIATDPAGILHMAYLDEAGSHIKYMTYSNGTWSQPLQIDNTPDTIIVMRPNISIDPNFGIYVTWVQQTDSISGKIAYNVFYATSPDGGQTWNEPQQLSNCQYVSDGGYSVRNPTIGKKVRPAIEGIFDGGADVVWTEANPNSSLGYYIMYARIPYVGTIVGVNESNKIKEFALDQNYPNPFNPSTTIEYSIPNVATQGTSPNVQLIVYDVLGRKVKTLVNKKQSPGNYSVRFDASELNSGVYFYTLRAGSFVATKKMILMK